MQGAQEIFQNLPHEMVRVSDLPDLVKSTDRATRHKVPPVGQYSPSLRPVRACVRHRVCRATTPPARTVELGRA